MVQICSFLNSFQSLLNPEIILNCVTENNKYNKLIFRENSDGSSIKKLNIDHIPKNSIVFTLDLCVGKNRFPQLSQYLNSQRKDGLNKSCDIVIMVCNNEDIDVYFFDLKSEKIKSKDCSKQLKNSELFVLGYLLKSLMKNYHTSDYDNVKLGKVRRIIGSPNTQLRKNTGRPNDNRNDFKDFLPLTINTLNNGEGYISFNKFK
ncbi:hypothetical protein [Moraxella sp. VT-16-12]|uniref:hypothetical protein n=1 Tax=Moraxella sp. VT-16-12 TaxID=2014877 RepID=UPI000B7FD3A9|nr:hypothetical protein [Moraxella sp. VT-16-12]TWV83910.1 hypothetical protein CEW93_001900 [Moraxella sp. VT-16-12]